MTNSIALPMLDLPKASLERELGSLLLKKGDSSMALPLKDVDIKAKVIDRIAEVTIKSIYRNDHTEHLEAVYIFPMAAGSAISNFNMHVGDRKIQGVIQERGEARRQYQQAVDDGKRAALLEQERDDVFTVQVGNLPPGEEVTIEITYSERLPFYEDGKTELRLPLVVAPRYIPGQELNRNQVGDGIEADTDIVPDASRISPPRLAKGAKSQTSLKLTVELLPEDGEITELACSQHAVKSGLSQDGIKVSLAKVDEKLNRDFVLRWTSAAGTIKSSLLTFTADDGETYGLLSITPPKRGGFLGAPRDVVFVLDRSGSMEGVKMISAIRACSILLNTLGPQDRFAIAAFDTVVDWMPGARGTRFTNSDIAGIEKGENFLRGITARGGTELNRCLSESFAALSQRHDTDGRMPSLVVLTDGEVGNESEILQQIQRSIGDSRLFSVGIDTAVNSGLLNRLANLGGGTATFVEPGVQLEEALASVSREIGSPLVSDLQVEDLDLAIDRASLSPSRVPDIFQGRASMAFLKLSGETKKGKLVVKGKFADGKAFEEKIKAQKVDMPAIAQLWAKAHIVDLEDKFRISTNEKALLKKRIVELAVKHSLLTKFTAFVVIDEAEIVNKTGQAHKLVQPVEMPEAWEMQGQVAGLAAGQHMSYQQAAPAMNRMKMCSAKAAPANARAQSMYDMAEADASNTGASGGFAAFAAESFDSGNSAWGAPCQQQPSSAPFRPSGAAPVPQEAAAPYAEPCMAPMPTPPMPSNRPAAQSPPAPTSQPSLVPQINSALGSLFKKMENLGQSLSTKDSGKLARNEVDSIKTLLQTLIASFEEAFDMLDQGKRPENDQLESNRVNLVQTIAPMKFGMECPALQRFLRSTAIELIGSLNDKSVTLDELKMFWSAKRPLFETVKAELEAALSGGKELAFWDSSV